MRKWSGKIAAKFLPTKEKTENTPRTRSKSDQPLVNHLTHSLNVVYESNEATIDIVAIHGLNGHWQRSWTDRDTGTFWLRDFLPQSVPETRILSFGYDSSQSSMIAMEDVAVGLVEELIRLRSETQTDDRSVIFIAHSIGGPLLKGALAICNNSTDAEQRGILSSTRGILFFGTVQDGDAGFDVLASLSSSAGNTPHVSASPLMRAYQRDLEWFQESGELFSKILCDFRTVYFTESSGDIVEHQGVAGQAEIGNFAAGNGVVTMPLGKTHGAMIRFSDENDRDYRVVERQIQEMVNRKIRTRAS